MSITFEEQTVYVVAFEGESCGGFNWFWKKEHADEEWEDAKANGGPQDLFYFEHKTWRSDPVEITAEIEEQLEDLCSKAPIKLLRKNKN